MKRLAVLSLAFLLIFGAGQLRAQKSENEQDMSVKKEKRVEKKRERKELRKLEGNKVSTASKQTFDLQFGSNIPNVKWTRTQDYDIADFVLKKHDMKAYFDADGELVGTVQPKTMDDLPDKGVRILQTKYKDYKIGKILYFDNNEDNASPMILWGTEILDRSNYFVELWKGDDKLVVYVDPGGNVTMFKKL